MKDRALVKIWYEQLSLSIACNYGLKPTQTWYLLTSEILHAGEEGNKKDRKREPRSHFWISRTFVPSSPLPGLIEFTHVSLWCTNDAFGIHLWRNLFKLPKQYCVNNVLFIEKYIAYNNCNDKLRGYCNFRHFRNFLHRVVEKSADIIVAYIFLIIYNTDEQRYGISRIHGASGRKRSHIAHTCNMQRSHIMPVTRYRRRKRLC